MAVDQKSCIYSELNSSTWMFQKINCSDICVYVFPNKLSKKCIKEKEKNSVMRNVLEIIIPCKKSHFFFNLLVHLSFSFRHLQYSVA